MTLAPARKVFVVEGLASAQLPLRLLNYFAQQDLLPEAVDLRRSPLGIAMRIVDATLDDHRAAIVLAKMQALPDVASAMLEPWKPSNTWLKVVPGGE